MAGKRRNVQGEGVARRSSEGAGENSPRRAGSLAPLLSVGFLTLAAFGLYAFLVNSPLYRVKEIIVTGNDRVPKTEVIHWANLKTDDSLFRIDIRRAAEQLTRHPWVEEAAVERVLPDRLAVTVKERTPYARLSRRSATYVLDDEGVVLQEGTGETELYQSLPLILADDIPSFSAGQRVDGTPLLRGLEVLKQAGWCPWAIQRGIVRVEMEKQGPVVSLKGQPLRIRFGQADPKAAWSQLQAISPRLEGRLERIEQIDLFFESQVVIR